MEDAIAGSANFGLVLGFQAARGQPDRHHVDLPYGLATVTEIR
jgi:hypothetical protein